jgi:hypothetical protein
MKTARPPRRRWLQFSLRSVLVLTAVLAVALAWGNRVVARYTARQRIEELPVKVEIEPGPPWVGGWFGGEVGKYFDQVRAVDCSTWDGLSDTSQGKPERVVLLLKDLGRQTGLRKLDLSNVYAVDNDGLDALSSLSELEELSLDGANITDDGLRHLAGFTNLRKLSLYAAHGITGRGLSHLAALQQLKELDLAETECGDESAAALARLVGLRRLNLAFTPAGDACLAGVVSLDRLEHLNLSGTKITSAGLAHLADLPDLRELYAAHTGVDDGGLDHLRRLPLRLLSLAQTAVSEGRRAELSAIDPELSAEGIR